MTCFGVSALVVLFSATVADPDLWGHLKFGQDLMSSGQVIRSDPYSYMTGDQVWINHEWLAEAIFALVYSALGATGLIVFKLLLALGICGLAYRYLRSCGLAELRTWALVVSSGLLMVTGLGNIRPQMFTWAFFAVQLFALMRVENGRAGWLWILPPMFALWPNLHGGFLAGAGILLIWLLCYGVRFIQATSAGRTTLSPRPRIVLAVMAMTLFATLLTPYRAELLRFLLETATVPRPDISEWLPTQIVSVPGALYLLLLLTAVGALVYSHRSLRLFPVLAFTVTAILPLIARRHEPLFALGVLFLAGETISSAWEHWSKTRDADKIALAEHRLFGSVFTFVFLVCTVLFVIGAAPQLSCIGVVRNMYPLRAVALLKAAGAKGDMATEFDWGQYLIWHLGPDVRVSLDGRRETVYSETQYRKGLNFMRGQGDWNAVLRESDVELALVKAEWATYNLLKREEGWDLLFEDSVSALFVQQASPLAGRIRTAAPPEPLPEGSRLCFR